MPQGELVGIIKDVLRPKDLPELLSLLAELEGPRRLLAGGTDLLAQAKDAGYPAATWFDVWSLDELRRFEVGEETIVLGANVTMTQVEQSHELKAFARALWDGCWEAGSVQIRNRATLGGNAGNASPAADSVPGLISLGAEAHLCSQARGERTVLVEKLAVAPRNTVIEPDEVITHFSWTREPGSVGAYLRLGQRKAQAISKVSVAATATLTDEVVHTIRIALGAVAPTIVRVPDTEAYLKGKPLNAGTLNQAMEVVRTEITPIDDIRSTKAYRQQMAGVLLKRVLERLASAKPACGSANA